MSKYYFTLGQSHAHRINGRTIDKDCVAVVNAASYEEARSMFFEWTDGKFHNQYSQEEYDKRNVDNALMQYFPRGLVEVNPQNDKDDFAQERRAVELMIRQGGGFVHNLGKAWAHADPANRARLREAFGDILQNYQEKAGHE